MADSSPRKDEIVKAPNNFERTKEAIEAISHKHQDRETHGLRDDIDESTPVHDVKAPNVFERAKEEIDAIVEAIHPRKECTNHQHESKRSDTESDSHPHRQDNKDGKASNSVDHAKMYKPSSPVRHHHKETHGLRNDIDENTPVDDVKGPNLFERAKEEVEAIIQAIHGKKS